MDSLALKAHVELLVLRANPIRLPLDSDIFYTRLTP